MSIGRQQAVAARMRAVSHHFSAVFGEPLQSADISALKMPMLFLAGERTVDSTRRIRDLLRAASPKAEHAVMQGTAHMGPITHASLVNGRIEDFLRRHARARSRLAVTDELSEVI